MDVWSVSLGYESVSVRWRRFRDLSIYLPRIANHPILISTRDAILIADIPAPDLTGCAFCRAIKFVCCREPAGTVAIQPLKRNNVQSGRIACLVVWLRPHGHYSLRDINFDKSCCVVHMSSTKITSCTYHVFNKDVFNFLTDNAARPGDLPSGPHA